MKLLVNTSPPLGSNPRPGHRYAVNLVRALARRPHTHVTVVADAPSFADYEQRPDVQLVDRAAIADARSTIARCDLVVQLHPFQHRPAALPTAVVVHDVDVYDASWAYGDSLPSLVRSLHKNLIRADVVVSGSPYVLQRIIEIEPLAAGKTVLAVAPPFSSASDSAERTQTPPRLPPRRDRGRPLVLFPAELLPQSNHWNVLTAIRELCRAGCGVQLVCLAETCKAWGRAVRRRVDYLGMTDVRFATGLSEFERTALTRDAACFVSAGLSEPGAEVAQDALLHGVAVACSATPGSLSHLDRIRLDVPTFDPYDVESIAAALTATIERSERIVDGYCNARSVVDDWSWDRLADEIVTSFEVVRT